MERSHCKKPDVIDPTLAVNKGKCDGRLPLQKPVKSMGVSVIRRRLPTGHRQLPCQSYVGHLCLQGDKETSEIHELVPGSRRGGEGCSSSSMGSGVLRLSSSSTDPEGSTEVGERKDQSRDDLAKVAVSSVVASCSKSFVGSDPSPAQLQDYPDDGGQVPEPPLPRPPGGCSSSIENLNFTSEPGLNAFLAQHLAKGTQKGYNSCYSRFVFYCSSKNIDPESCNPEAIAKYIQYLFESGSSYSSVNMARSAISKFHLGYNGSPAGQHKIVCNAVKAVFRLRPPLPKYKETYDVTIVLNYLKNLAPNPQLPLKLLSYKSLFLLTVSTISRVSSVAQLGPDISIHKVSAALIN